MLFALGASGPLGEQVARALGGELSAYEERAFEDGEHKLRPLVNVRGRDVFVLASLAGDREQSVNDRLCRLLFFLGALRDAAAGRLTAVVPYLCYARKDRKSKARDPVTTRYVAAMFEAVGVDRVTTLEVHNLAAFQNAFRIGTDHLDAHRLFAEYVATLPRDGGIVVVSPDIGGIKRAESFRQVLSKRLGTALTTAFADKQRSAGRVTGEALVGDVRGRTVILIDDLIASGTTIARVAESCVASGARAVHALATHGVFTAQANRALASPAVTRIALTNSIPAGRLDTPDVLAKLDVVDIAPLLAESIARLHIGGSLVELLAP